MEKNLNISKQSHAQTGYVSNYNIEVLNIFNHELQLKDIESVIENKVTDFLFELGGFGLVTR